MKFCRALYYIFENLLIYNKTTKYTSLNFSKQDSKLSQKLEQHSTFRNYQYAKHSFFRSFSPTKTESKYQGYNAKQHEVSRDIKIAHLLRLQGKMQKNRESSLAQKNTLNTETAARGYLDKSSLYDNIFTIPQITTTR